MSSFVNLKPPTPPKGRVLTCTGCLELVMVYEAPAGWIDAGSYLCVECDPPVSATVLLDQLRDAEPAPYFQARFDQAQETAA